MDGSGHSQGCISNCQRKVVLYRLLITGTDENVGGSGAEWNAEVCIYSIRMSFQQLATATPYEILSLYADSDRPIHGLFSRGYHCTRSPV